MALRVLPTSARRILTSALVTNAERAQVQAVSSCVSTRCSSRNGRREDFRSGNRPGWSCTPEGREEERHRCTGERVPRGQWHVAGTREVEWGLRVDAGADRKLDGQKRPTVGVSAGSGDHSRGVIYPTSRDGPLGERPSG